MTELTDRQEKILGLVIREYIDTSIPIGSKNLVAKYNLGLSSATIRNEMAVLTERGYLRQPHTSAGRVPTEEGYRYFVQRILGETELPVAEQRLISHQFHQAHGEVDQWMRLAASVLAQHARAASLVTAPQTERARFKRLEQISTQGRMVLMVLVLHSGEVRQQMLTLAEPVPQETLTETAGRINAACLGLEAEAVAALAPRFPTLGDEVLRLAADVMGKADALLTREVYRDGLTTVLSEKEFKESDTARQALRMLEERSMLDEVLAKVLSPAIGGVQVIIGGEGYWEELKECSMVLARYGVTGGATGALGVLGPTRMPYGRAISAVRYVAGMMSDLMYEMGGE
ncbi:MAG: heat-inducible transcription repressor HrcA [Chloroflexi bacterium]|nr:heat-inducible transcription repressor HrcA [Chloroflexota bacterium]